MISTSREPLARSAGAAHALLALLCLSFVGGVQAAVSLPDFTGLVDKHSAAVVNISTTQKQQRRPNIVPKDFEMPDLPEDSPFREFFKRFFGEGGEIEEFDSESLGSGFIISSDGYIITNNHVIRNADEIIVKLKDRRELKAKLIGGDERSDVALLKIDAQDLPAVKLASGDNLKVGEWVLAIGSPFGFDYSVTAGIVSAKGRSLSRRESYVPFIQTDVAINPGNSGGPLFNLDGEVVGVNSQIFSRTGTFMGLSFAIPINVAMDVADQLKSKGRVSRGWLGVLIQNVNRDLAESFGMGKPQGALIVKVLDGSPAAEAGFEVGDIVLKFDGRLVDKSSDLPPIVGSSRVGGKVGVDILRNGDSRKLEVVLAELPEEAQASEALPQSPARGADNKLGIAVVDPSAEQRGELELADHGVIVEEIESGPAQEAGVREGDVILMLNNEKVANAEDFERLAAELPGGKAVSVLVQRSGNPIFLALKTEE